MSRDPLNELRLDVREWRNRPALDRIRTAMEAQEAAEVHASEVRAYEREAAAEVAAAHREAQDRVEILTMGRTNREIEQEAATREQVRQAKVAELEAELDKLDPVRRSARQAERRQVARDAEMEATLKRARELSLENNPFMRRVIMQFHERGAAREAEAMRRQSAARQREIDDYERRYVSR